MLLLGKSHLSYEFLFYTENRKSKIRLNESTVRMNVSYNWTTSGHSVQYDYDSKASLRLLFLISPAGDSWASSPRRVLRLRRRRRQQRRLRWRSPTRRRGTRRRRRPCSGSRRSSTSGRGQSRTRPRGSDWASPVWATMNEEYARVLLGNYLFVVELINWSFI